MKKIALRGKWGLGKFTLVDDEDFEKVNKFKWNLNQKGYVRGTARAGRNRLHRYLMQCPKGLEIDHINGDKLNNRKENLRICTCSQNSKNKKKGIRNNQTSKYKGVTFVSGGWRVHVWNNYRKLYLGEYKTEHLAAIVYDFAVKQLHGEFAKTNF